MKLKDENGQWTILALGLGVVGALATLAVAVALVTVLPSLLSFEKARTTSVPQTPEPTASRQGPFHDPVPPAPTQPAAVEVGQPATSGDFEFRVTRVERTSTLYDDVFEPLSARGEFVLVHVAVTNVGTTPRDATVEATHVLIDVDGREFGEQSEASIYGDDTSLSLEGLNPGLTQDRVLAFDVPAGTQASQIEFQDTGTVESMELDPTSSPARSKLPAEVVLD